MRLLLGGDVNINREVPATALRPVAAVLAEADVRFVNLEGPLSEPSPYPSRPDIAHKPRWRHSPPRMVDGLVAAGIDVVSCANNVTYPPAAALASSDVLDSHGIAHCGAGIDRAAARTPAIVQRAGVRVGFLACTSIFFPYGHAAGDHTPGVATAWAETSYRPDPRIAEVPGRPPVVRTVADPDDLAALRDDVRRLRDQVDVVVVSMHWGVPGDGVCDYQRQFAYAAIDAGAHIIAGHGTHDVHGIEFHRSRPILYGLGNLVFDWPTMRGRGGGMLATVDVAQRRLTLHLVSATDEHGSIRLLAPADVGAAVAGRVTRLSAALGTTVLSYVTHLDVAWPDPGRCDDAQADPAPHPRLEAGGSAGNR
ncbi:CapA family protein [Krasilnikovia sp. MM14-A1259]|uniref:CapA family protein n=1 Tax=Krasilnikovia sp. MM14-A1259 TaxID=3373539 RepID=UPI003808AD46